VFFALVWTANMARAWAMEGKPKESGQVFMIFISTTTSTTPTAMSTAGCLAVWKKAVLFAQKLYIQSSLIGALARGPCSSSLPAKV
jgi:hypothetical protein